MRKREQHRQTYTRLYHIWCNIKARCNNPNSYAFHRYGGRGIIVCQEWNNSFSKFKEWADRKGYSDTLEIDRIKNDGNYEPNNCRFTSRLAQSNNRSSNFIIKAFEKSKTLMEWERETGIRRETIRKRLRYGWNPEKALTMKPIIGRNQCSNF